METEENLRIKIKRKLPILENFVRAEINGTNAKARKIIMLIKKPDG